MLLGLWRWISVFTWANNYIIFLFFFQYIWIFFSMSLDNVNVIFCSWLFPWVSPSPGSSLRCAWAADGSHEQHLAVPPQWGSACAGGHLSSQYVPLAEQPCSLCSPRAQIQDVDGHVAVLQKGSAGYIIWTWINSVILLAYIGCASPHGQLISAVIFAFFIAPAWEYPWYLFFWTMFLKKPFKF